MNAKQAKRLRKIAAELGRPVDTSYGWSGDLRRRPAMFVNGRRIPGQPIRRHLELGDCQRRAQQEAKKLYKEQGHVG